MPGYAITIDAGIAHLVLTRPNAGNALSAGFWNGLAPDIGALNRTGDVRAMVLSSEGPIFCAGMDLGEFAGGIPDPDTPAARESFYHLAISLQETFSCLERARFPVFAAIQGACLGAGLELAAACDLRYASRDAYFRIEEINTGIMADVGALQRLPKILPEPVVKEMALLGRTLSAEDAARHGFVADIADTSSGTIELAYAAARRVLEKAPIAIAGTKAALRWARDHSVSDALEWSARTQSALWSTHDISSSIGARKARSTPEYQPLLPKSEIGRMIPTAK
tara:strand:- start:401 stop:1243 length:843 start_codon:yes stop_codon:yes gene_type:complete